MKKTTQVIKERTSYDISVLINDIALIYSSDKTSALLNIKNNELVTKFDDYYTVYDESNKLYFLTDGKKSTYIIYDALNNKVIAENYELVKKQYGKEIYKSNATGKYHKYYCCNFRKKGNIFDIALDDIKAVTEYIYILTKDGKKALYDDSKDDKPNFIYDDIKFEEGFFTLTIGDKKYIRFLSWESLSKEEFGPFNDVFAKDYMIYCKKGDITEVYQDNKLLLSNDNADNIKLLTKTSNSNNPSNYRYLFEIESNGKKSVVAIYYNGNEYKSEVVKGTEGADEITVSRGIHLRFGNEYKLLMYAYYGEHITDKKYKRIDYLGNGFYIFYKGKKSDIYQENRGMVVENITCLKSVTDDGIEYIKNNKKCLAAFHYHYNYIDKVNLYENYDEFEYLNGVYKTKKNNKKGLIINGNEVKPDYKEIKITDDDDKDKWLIFEKFDGKFDLKKFCYYLSEKITSKRENLNSVEFLTDIIVIKDVNKTLIMDYKENILKTFTKDVQVSEIVENRENKDKILYKINDDIYFYKKNKFEKAKMYEQDKYITDYEDDEKNIIRIETTDKELHDNLCSIIEETNLQGQTLVDKIYSDSFDMRMYHKGVVKLLTKKKLSEGQQ